MNLKLKVWRQSGPKDKGRFQEIPVADVSPDSSLFEMLDLVNQKLITEGQEPIHFDNDCREGICGTCGLVVNGVPHGHMHATTTCQLHMRMFEDGSTIVLEPWRSRAFPVLKDLIVDRSAFDRIIEAGGYIGVDTGSAPDANAILVRKDQADFAFESAACIGCGACVAACPNASAMLFTAAKVSHLGLLPQGQAERSDRVVKMIAAMDAAGFGTCTNHGECEAVCPKEIKLPFIARMNRDFLKALVAARSLPTPVK
jgi:succinate dehydrogenase / fumarate reductase iron-sulfur subunit